MFSNTNGTWPMAGVDVEPDTPGDTLQDITFRRCRASDNAGGGFAMNIMKLEAHVNSPITITFEDCHVADSPGRRLRADQDGWFAGGFLLYTGPNPQCVVPDCNPGHQPVPVGWSCCP